MNRFYAFRGHDPNLRAGDADRERIAEILRKQHTEGRLDTDEFQQRIDGCYSAKTLGDLDELLHDLPTEPHPDHRPRGIPGLRMLGRPRMVPLILAAIVISAVTGAHLFWIPFLVFFVCFGVFGRRYRRYRRWGAYPMRGVHPADRGWL